MKISSIIVLILAAHIAMQCGGSSSDSSASSSAFVIDTGNIKPKPQLRSKWVYDYTKYGEKTRIAFEITSINGTFWTKTQINEGVIVDQKTYHYKVDNGLTYYSQLETSRAFFAFEDNGQRAWITESEFPFSEIFKVASLSNAGIHTFSERNDYTLLGSEILNQGSINTLTNHIAKITSVANTEDVFEVQDSREQWINDTFGMVKETLNENGIPSQMLLTSYEDNADQHINIDGLTISSNTGSLVLEKSALIPATTPDAFFREIFTLASNYTENINKGKVSVSFAQNSHLFHRYYLNQNLLPSDLSNINSVEEYVTHIAQNDPFAFYFSPEAFNNFLTSLTGETSIIGLQMAHVDGSELTVDTVLSSGQIKILKVLPLSRGWNDGIEDGDLLMTINGNTFDNKKFSEIKELLPTSEAEQVDLGLERNGSNLTIQTASENHISKMLSNNIAYISIRKFTETTGSEVKKDIDDLIINHSTPSGLIMDLRYNSGGSARGTRILLDYMIDLDTPQNTNIIYSVKDSEEAYYFGSESEDKMFDLAQGKLVVLVNDSSASASEITAGTLKQYQNALLLGDKTFGKGVSQTIRKLIDGSGVAITFQELKVAGNIAYHESGFSPDIAYTTAPSSVASDSQLDAAIEYISTGNITGVSKPSLKTRNKPKRDIELDIFNLTL
jgi:carboxyl-terminal processing protease